MGSGIRRIHDKNRVKRNQHQHAQVRAAERYSVGLGTGDLVEMVRIIQSNDLVDRENRRFVCRHTNRITVFQVRLATIWYNVCYDNKRKSIATVLPADAWEAKALPSEEKPA